MSNRKIDLTGQRFGQVVVIENLGKDSKNRPMCLCQCDCGKKAEICQYYLTSGDTKSCGCLSFPLKDLIGERFNKFLVIKRDGNDKRGQSTWLCKCDCGTEKVINQWDLRSGNTKSCGCCRYKYKDLLNQRFSRLVVVAKADTSKDGSIKWKCKCDCGGQAIARGQALRSGSTKSCGCLRRENRLSAVVVHGQSESKEYHAWQSMKRRCNNVNNPAWKDYGGRGITVSEEWMQSFDNFIKDMGVAPDNSYTLGRINNEQGYCKENCRWETRAQQAVNTRQNLFLTFEGKSLTLAEWSRVVGILPVTIKGRLKLGWSVERALTTPVKQKP